MEQTTKTLKAGNVKLEGEVTVSGVNAAQQGLNGEPGAGMGPNVVVVESTAEYAVLEITCGCGNVTRIKCNYAAGVNAAQ